MTMLAKKPYLLFIFIACLTITLCFTTCKKYPEDNFYSLKNPEKRAIGTWSIIEYNYNGNSVIYEINNILQTFDIRDLKLIFKGRNGKNSPYYYFSPINMGTVKEPLVDKTKFRFEAGANTALGDLIKKNVFLTPLNSKGTNYTNWDIRNLYKDKMHLQLKTDSGNYDIYFEK
ncbi:MAG TPA: hypothetical protein PKZ75_15435 [Bacteroidia bacterium]|nr:hypothetical protein [Bacteroidia bacterium]